MHQKKHLIVNTFCIAFKETMDTEPEFVLDFACSDNYEIFKNWLVLPKFSLCDCQILVTALTRNRHVSS
jgi:hypothetical protein